MNAASKKIKIELPVVYLLDDVLYLRAVMMFYGPHYNGGKPHFGRVNTAIDLAKRLSCPLIICGDGCRGEGVQLFATHALHSGLETPIYGFFNSKMNTRGDAESAADVVWEHLPLVRRLHVVTDWYHMPRACIALSQELDRRFRDTHRQFRLVPRPVLDHWQEGWKRLPGELRGCRDYLLQEPNLPSFFDRIGKPGAY